MRTDDARSPGGPCRPDPTVAPFAPQGRAVAAAWERRRRDDQRPVAPLEVHDGEGPPELVAPETFLREPAAFEAWERALLGACRGRVLDVGAGAGAHALWLQTQGHPVTALDVDPDTLAAVAARVGLATEVLDVFDDAPGRPARHVARLTRAPPGRAGPG